MGLHPVAEDGMVIVSSTCYCIRSARVVLIICRPLVILGVLLTVCALAIQPMIQQSVTYPVRNIAVGEANIPRAINYTQWSVGGGTDSMGGGTINRDQNGQL